MKEELGPYPEYKESGQDWMGKIPDHWSINRGKAFLQAIDKRSQAGSEELLTVSSLRGVVPRKTANVTMFKAASYAGYKLCWPKDLAINSLWAWAGGLGVSKYHGIISTTYSVFRLRDASKIHPGYLHELVRSRPFQWELQVRSKGVWVSRLQLSDSSFLDAPFLIPPLAEQSAIVKYLAYATSRIDATIKAKRKIIALLNEQKQAIIQRAVTKGLDPNVKMKDSGEAWIGEIPEHWELENLQHLLSFGPKNGISVPPSETGGVLSISISAIRNGIVEIAGNEKWIALHQKVIKKYELISGDILLVRGNGSIDLVAKCGLVEKCPSNCVYPDILMKLRPN